MTMTLWDDAQALILHWLQLRVRQVRSRFGPDPVTHGWSSTGFPQNWKKETLELFSEPTYSTFSPVVNGTKVASWRVVGVDVWTLQNLLWFHRGKKYLLVSDNFFKFLNQSLERNGTKSVNQTQAGCWWNSPKNVLTSELSSQCLCPVAGPWLQYVCIYMWKLNYEHVLWL